MPGVSQSDPEQFVQGRLYSRFLCHLRRPPANEEAI